MTAPLSTGLAAFGAGEGPAGHDPEDEIETLPKQTPIASLDFDPYDRVYAQNDDYTMVEGSGPIQRAAHLMLPLGSIGATSTDGLDVDSIRRAPPPARRAAIEDALRRTWKVLLETKQISMGSVRVLGNPYMWNGKFEVDVRDLVTQRPATLEGKVN